MVRAWKPGRGKLGVLDPLLGTWVALGESPMGPYRCERRFARVLGGAYVQLDAVWRLGATRYEERALFGVADDGLRFWSFTSDKKRSTGWRSHDGDGLPDGALVFEAEMPAGRARQAYWPTEQGIAWVVEARTKAGWSRFTEHGYMRAENPPWE